MYYDFIFFAVCAFIWGAIWGSFLNVVVYRLPRGLSLSSPRSHCPACEHQIRWYENIPIVSWLALRARCSGCGSRIPARYPMVELLTASLSLLLFIRLGHAWDIEQPAIVLVPFAFYFLFICAVIAIAFIDLELTLIPDALSVPTAVLGVIAAFAIPESGAYAAIYPNPTWLDSVIGWVCGFGSLFSVFVLYKAATGRIGMGSGDFFMLGMIGAYLGWQSLPVILFLASAQGLVLAVAALLAERVMGDRAAILLRGVHKQAFWDNHPTEGLRGDERTVSAVHREDRAHLALIESGDEADGGEANQRTESPAASGEGDEADDDSFGKLGLPFGPFLGLAAIEYLYFGRALNNVFMGGL